MPPKNGRDSAEELVIQFLKKNKNFFINYPRIIGELNFPDKTPRSEKIIDLSAYRSKKISSDNARLKKQMLEILKAGKSHMVAQKRILKTSLKILILKLNLVDSAKSRTSFVPLAVHSTAIPYSFSNS